MTPAPKQINVAETTQSLDLTAAMARFAIALHDFPPLARRRALDAVTDCVACMFAGSREALAQPLLIVLPSVPAAQPLFESTLIGTTRFAAPADAALYNGAIAHALDYDDTNHPAYAHPSAAIVPALLAVAPQCKATGADLIDAYIAGFEIVGKLGRALNTQHYKRGWHATSTFGTLAATVAVGRLMRLTQNEMVMAIGIAASSASGLRANFGSMVKPLHAGYAARNGVLAVLLAREGFDATAKSLEHRYGYVSVFNDGIGFDTAPLMALGGGEAGLEILTQHGLALKPFPSCGATHPGIEAAMALHADIGGREIRSVKASVCEMAFSPLIYVMPETPLEGKFSLHYCVAAALLMGEVNLGTFTAARIADVAVRKLIPLIDMQVDERWRTDGEFSTEITVETEDGARLSRHVPLAMGKPDRWFTPARLRAKFDDCTAAFLPAFSEALYQSVRTLDAPLPLTSLLQSLSTARLQAGDVVQKSIKEES